MVNFKKIIAFILMLVLIILPLNLTSCSINILNIKNKEIEESANEVEFSGVPNSRIVSTFTIPGQAIDIDISGNYAYLTNDLGILYIVDIKDKNNPVVVGKCNEVDSANIVIVRDEYAYISYTKLIYEENKTYTNCGFYIVDVSDKRNPKIIGNYNTGEDNEKSAYGLFIEGDYAYIETVVEGRDSSSGSLEIVDISAKKNPGIISKCSIDGVPSNIWIKENLAYINTNFYDYKKEEFTDNSKLLIINIQDKDNPEIIGSCNIHPNSWGIYVAEKYTYISSWKWDKKNERYTDSVFQVIDINEPSNPKTLGSCEIPGGAWEMDSAGGFIYVSSLSGGIYAIDVKDKNKPVIVDSLITGGTSYDITIKGNYGYIADGFEGMSILELSGKNAEEDLDKYKVYIDNTQDKNLPPEAFIEVIGDKFEEDYFQIKNPVYITARKTFDPDGDELNYQWIIDGDKYSNEESFLYYFNQPGNYEIKLIASDGLENSEAVETILVAEVNLPVILYEKHNFKIEIEYNLINKSPESLKNIECFMRIPQTYYPYQIINNYIPDSSNVSELFDNNWNLLVHFDFKDELKGNKSLTASAVIDLTAYEFKYVNIKDGNLIYDEKDKDLKKYTIDDLFIDSDSPEIKNTAERLVGNETDPVKIAEILYNFVIKRLRYDYSRAEKKDYKFLYASEILKRGRGVCADYAILYTALLRSAGIPSRLVAGIPVYSILYEKDKEINMGHAWVEVKIPGYGWMPVDITLEDGFLSPNYYMNIASEKGSGYLYENKTMDWASYYHDGFLFSWDDNGIPETEQNFVFRIIDLDLEDIKLD